MHEHPCRRGCGAPRRGPRSGSAPARVLFVIAGTAVLAAGATAQTPFLPPEEIPWDEPLPTGPDGDRGRVVWPEGRINSLFELDQIVAFLDLWQERDPGPDFGGMIEAEAGPLGDVIQTDNTLEAIQVWSHYTELTGSTEYLDNIADAWVYCQNWPAWLEEGGDGYYRVHNCAWGLAAESAYRSATGDDSYLDYAATCADYIVATPLYLSQYARINAFTEGWAAGNLYLYAEEMGSATWRDAAVAYGQDLLDWVAYDPPAQLSAEYWAMSSGTLVWGACNSILRDDPAAGEQWVEQYGALVDTFQTWYQVDYYSWDNAWNVAYVNAHFAMGDISGDPVHTGIGEKLTRKLLSYDTDDDGGIPATTQDPVTEDMSWVTSYLAMFGVARMLGTPPQVDAGILGFPGFSLEDTLLYPVDGPIPVQAVATNFGLQPLSGVEVHLTGAASGSATIDLDFVERETVELHPGWTPPAPGVYQLTAYTIIAGDEESGNDSLTVTLHVLDAASAPPAPVAARLGRAVPNPARGRVELRLHQPQGQALQAEVIDVSGRRLAMWRFPAGGEERRRIVWRGRDRSGRP
ncbi:MAG: hypothetical protein GF355_15710, partial [Candidatus Eisenbacteria bacterium]|nr:hypothetical protein [Candidatus Eisenbacteria bacterium]